MRLHRASRRLAFAASQVGRRASPWPTGSGSGAWRKSQSQTLRRWLLRRRASQKRPCSHRLSHHSHPEAFPLPQPPDNPPPLPFRRTRGGSILDSFNKLAVSGHRDFRKQLATQQQPEQEPEPGQAPSLPPSPPATPLATSPSSSFRGADGFAAALPRS